MDDYYKNFNNPKKGIKRMKWTSRSNLDCVRLNVFGNPILEWCCVSIGIKILQESLNAMYVKEMISRMLVEFYTSGVWQWILLDIVPGCNWLTKVCIDFFFLIQAFYMHFKSEYKTQMDYIYGGGLIDFVFYIS